MRSDGKHNSSRDPKGKQRKSPHIHLVAEGKNQDVPQKSTEEKNTMASVKDTLASGYYPQGYDLLT